MAVASDARAGLPFSEENCREIFESELRVLGGKIEHPVKYLIREGERVPVEDLDTHHIQGMLGQWGNRVETALYRDANSILFLSDGKEALKVDRLGPVIAKEFPKKTVVSAEVQVEENRFVQNWGYVKVDNLERFPVKDNSFDRVVLRRGMCVCHNEVCCAGFKPGSPEAGRFFSEVIRVLDKSNPNAFAVLHGVHNVGGNDLMAWVKHLEELRKTKPFRYRILMSNGSFHSILIQPL